MARSISRNINTIFELHTANSNVGTETITATNGFTITKHNHTNEYYDENIPSKYIIDGKLIRNRQTIIATIKVEAESGKQFRARPKLATNFNRNIKLKITNTGRSNGNITSYTMDLLYINDRSVSTIDNITATLRYSSQTIYAKTLSIDRIVFGSTNVRAGGEWRQISIYGHKDAVFALSITNEKEESIISNKYTSNIIGYDLTIKNKNGLSTPIIKRKIGNNGVFTFNQRFPSIVKKVTRLNGVHTDVKKLLLYDTENVEEDDNVIMKEISTGTTVTVDQLDPDGDNEKEIFLSSFITAPTNAQISFQKNTTYAINIIPSLSSTLGSNISTTSPSYTLYQYMDPTLTLKVSTATNTYTINDGAAGAEYYQYVSGVANTTVGKLKKRKGLFNTTTGKYDNNFKVTLNLAVVNTGAHTFTAARKPSFSATVPHDSTNPGTPAAAQLNDGSDWTNTIASDNGGTVVTIFNPTVGSIGATTLTITYNVSVIKWGTEDVTMDLNLDNILTAGA